MSRIPVPYALRAYKSGILVAYPDREYIPTIRQERKTYTKSDYISASSVIDALENNETPKKHEKIKRNYRISRNRVRSACVDLWHNRTGNCLLFLTITINSSIGDKKQVEKNTGKAYKILLDQLRNQYRVKKYVS